VTVSVCGTAANAPSTRSTSGDGSGSAEVVRYGEPSTDASERSNAGVSSAAVRSRAQSSVVGCRRCHELGVRRFGGSIAGDLDDDDSPALSVVAGDLLRNGEGTRDEAQEEDVVARLFGVSRCALKVYAEEEDAGVGVGCTGVGADAGLGVSVGYGGDIAYEGHRIVGRGYMRRCESIARPARI
jgi:hypothetical protein